MEQQILNTPVGAIPFAQSGSGEPVIVLHRDTGWHGGSAFQDLLAEQFHVISLSIPGFNGAGLAQSVRDVFHLSAYVGQAIDALGLDRPASLVGLGFGGWVAASLAAMSPGRVARLGLVAPMGIRPGKGEVLDQFLIPADQYIRMSIGDTALYEELYTNEPDGETLERWDRNRETVTRVSWKPIGHDPQLPELLKSLQIPTLIVWGDADRIVPPSCADQWTALLPKSEAKVMSGGHYLELENPAELSRALVDFLRA